MHEDIGHLRSALPVLGDCFRVRHSHQCNRIVVNADAFGMPSEN